MRSCPQVINTYLCHGGKAVESWVERLFCPLLQPWKTGGIVAGELPIYLFFLYILIYLYPPTVGSMTRSTGKLAGMHCLLGRRGKMMRRGERATPREHQLACCSPSRTCVLRSEPRSTRMTVLALPIRLALAPPSVHGIPCGAVATLRRVPLALLALPSAFGSR